MQTTLNQILNIKHPLIMAPMFLVSNTAMTIAGMQRGVAACIPALNYRTLEELRDAIRELKAAKVEGGSFGINLIVNKSNFKYKDQLQVCCEEGVDFIITSLGSPRHTISLAKPKGIKVFIYLDFRCRYCSCCSWCIKARFLIKIKGWGNGELIEAFSC